PALAVGVGPVARVPGGRVPRIGGAAEDRAARARGPRAEPAPALQGAPAGRFAPERPVVGRSAPELNSGVVPLARPASAPPPVPAGPASSPTRPCRWHERAGSPRGCSWVAGSSAS